MSVAPDVAALPEGAVADPVASAVAVADPVASAVAGALRFDRSTLVQIIDRLEDRGLVMREVSAHDRRSYALKLTGVGSETLAELKKLALDQDAALAEDLSDQEREDLMGLLRRIYDAPGS